MNSDLYSVHFPSAVYGGADSLKKLSFLANGHKKAAIFTDRGICDTGLLESPLSILEQSKIEYEIFNNLPSEPTADQAQDIIDAFKSCGADWIIAIGGGSVMDIAKLASVCSNRTYKIRDLIKNPECAQKSVQTLMIPTTAGTGSEATPNSIVTVPEQKLKVGIVNSIMIADTVILDAHFIQKLPKSIAAATGLDALCHALECYTGNKANAFSDLFAMEALRLIFKNLETACGNENAINEKQAMLTASFYAGIAISAAGTTAVHALAYPLGGKYHIAHGISNAMLLSPVMCFNESAIRPRLASVYDEVGDGKLITEADKSAWIITRISKMVQALDIPTSLLSFGVSKNDLPTLVNSGMQVTRLLNNNVKKVTAEDAKMIYSQLL